MKPLVIVFLPLRRTFTVGRAADLAAKGKAQLLSRLLTGNDSGVSCLVGEAVSLQDAVKQVEGMTHQLAQGNEKQELWCIELHLWGGKGGQWN